MYNYNYNKHYKEEIEMNINKLTSAICDMEDIKETIKKKKLWEHLKDNIDR